MHPFGKADKPNPLQRHAPVAAFLQSADGCTERHDVREQLRHRHGLSVQSCKSTCPTHVGYHAEAHPAVEEPPATSDGSVVSCACTSRANQQNKHKRQAWLLSHRH